MVQSANSIINRIRNETMRKMWNQRVPADYWYEPIYSDKRFVNVHFVCVKKPDDKGLWKEPCN